MSLEQTLETTNDLLKQIIVILQTGVSAPAEIGAAEKSPATDSATKRASRAKKEPVAGTTYWHIPSFNSVFAQEPGMAAPTMADAVKIGEEEYTAKKSAQMAATQQAIADHSRPTTTGASTEVSPAATQPTAEAAAADAQPQKTTGASATASTAAAPAASPAQSEIKFADVLAKFKELNASKEAGHGREGVMAVLKKFLPNDAAPTVSKIESLGRNVEVMAALNELLTPAAADDFDPLA